MGLLQDLSVLHLFVELRTSEKMGLLQESKCVFGRWNNRGRDGSIPILIFKMIETESYSKGIYPLDVGHPILRNQVDGTDSRSCRVPLYPLSECGEWSSIWWRAHVEDELEP